VHDMVTIKVNATVDANIAPVVRALNEFADVLTLDSCQDSTEGAYVYFALSEESNCRLPAFCAGLAEDLSAGLPAGHGLSLRVEWAYDFESCMAKLIMRPVVVHFERAAKGPLNSQNSLDDGIIECYHYPCGQARQDAGRHIR